MLKHSLKFAVSVLLLLCLVAAPLFGVAFYDSPSVFSDNAFFTNRQFDNGTSIYLKFEDNTITPEDLGIVQSEPETTQEPAETAEPQTEETAQPAETAEPAETTEGTENAENAESGTGTNNVIINTKEYTKEDYEKAAASIETRLKTIGYNDTVALATDDGQVRVDTSMKSQAELDSMYMVSSTYTMDYSPVFGFYQQGSWSIKSSAGNTLCDASMIKNAEITSSSYGYFIRLNFTEEGAKQFEENCTPLATTSQSAKLSINGIDLVDVPLSNVKFGKTFTINAGTENGIQYGFNTQYATWILSYMRSEALPATMEVVSVETLAPSLPQGVILGVGILFAVTFLACAILLIAQGRMAGLFAAGALLGDVAAMLIFMVNKAFQVNLGTVIALYVCMLLAGIFFLFTVRPCGKVLKNKQSIRPVLSGPVKKMNIRCLWIHAIIFAVSLALVMLLRGSVVYIAYAVMVASVVNFVSYFALFLFPAYTLAGAQSDKK